MSLALYRRYRSRSLDEVVGQDHVTKLLAAAIKQDKVAHAYLFTGPRGVGKTSIARILAHEINQLPYSDESAHLDIIEIDAASNNGVEDIRDLRDRVQIAPVSAKKKIYIIDEVHMLSKQAFNALLKTLEEPPEHVVFILATTDLDKVPETIISRTQRHSFRRASEADIIKNLQRIAKAEKANVDHDALTLVAKHADGSFRDSVSLFDQLISGSEGEISKEHVIASLGLVPHDTIDELLRASTDGDVATVNQVLTDLEAQGVPPRTTASQIADQLRSKLASDPSYARLLNDILDVSRSQYPELKLLTALCLFSAPEVAIRPASAPVSLPVAANPTVSSAPEPPKPVAPRKSVAAVAQKPKTEPVALHESEPEPALEPMKKGKTGGGQPFDWETFVNYIRTHHVALHSVLSKCEPEVIDGTLTLYSKNAFYKKKLDDTRYKTLLHSALIELGYDLEIEIDAAGKPLQDSQAAKVAAIMGGGEEVSVD